MLVSLCMYMYMYMYVYMCLYNTDDTKHDCTCALYVLTQRYWQCVEDSVASAHL